ncbi:MAG TPA: hypothetical protein VEA59_00640 [Patescibacteria group bacterium]|nr:hypothetical protein [Patescibacteria group bacterium]
MKKTEHLKASFEQVIYRRIKLAVNPSFTRGTYWAVFHRDDKIARRRFEKLSASVIESGSYDLEMEAKTKGRKAKNFNLVYFWFKGVK